MRGDSDDLGAEFDGIVWDAFTNEAAIAALYLYFSSVAHIEHLPEVGEAFREMAESVSCIAHGHFDILRYETDPASGLPRGDTVQNLASAVHTATADASVRYAQMRQQARDAGLEDAVSWIDTVIALKRHHANRLAAMLDKNQRREEYHERRVAANPGDGLR
jgi:rubrerythrin